MFRSKSNPNMLLNCTVSKEIRNKQLDKDKVNKVYDVLMIFKESLSTSIVQVLFSKNSLLANEFQTTVTGVACLSKKGNEYHYIIEVGGYHFFI